MEKIIEVSEAEQQLGKILNEVAHSGDRYIVEAHGEQVAVVVPMALYDRWKRERDAFFRELRDISEQVNLSPQEAEQLAKEAIAAVRATRQA